MFAILVTDKMDVFYGNITSFPTVVFTVLLLFCFLYWLVAVIGLIDFDFLDFDLPSDDIDLGGNDSLENVNVLAGLLLRLGLNGVPFPIVFSIITIIGWLICYYAVYFIFPLVPGSVLEFLVGIPILIATFYFSALITGKIIKPLKSIFRAANQEVQKTILGKVAIVRTARVDADFGEAVVEDGGAGLIVKVRPYKKQTFTRGDRVVLLEHVREENIYKVISEQEFSDS